MESEKNGGLCIYETSLVLRPSAPALIYSGLPGKEANVRPVAFSERQDITDSLCVITMNEELTVR